MQPVILLVDDETFIRSALKRTFKEINFTVIEADSGKMALDILSRETVHIIVSDQKMPEMSGTELLAIVKEKYPQTGRIMLSGNSDFNDLCDAVNQANISRFFPKPWDNEELITAINDTMLTVKNNTEKSISTQAQEIIKKNSSRKNTAMAAIIKEAILRTKDED